MGLLRRPQRTSVEFALRAGVATIIAVGLSRLIGLDSPYWAGISAVVASAGSLGASISASITRIVATVIALAIATCVVLLPVDGLLVAGLTVTITLLIMASLRLDAGARLAGASTLLLTAIPGDDPLSTAIGRGLNVPLGCLVAVCVGFVVFPRRAVDELRIALTEDFIACLRLSSEAIDAWVDATVDTGLEDRVQKLLRDIARRDSVLTEASYEPGGLRGQSKNLARSLQLTKHVSRATRSLVNVTLHGRDDTVQRLLEPEMRAVSISFHQAVSMVDENFGTDPRSFAEKLRRTIAPSINALDEGFRHVREQRATAPFTDREVEHLLHAMWCIHAFDEAFEEAIASTQDE